MRRSISPVQQQREQLDQHSTLLGGWHDLPHGLLFLPPPPTLVIAWLPRSASVRRYSLLSDLLSALYNIRIKNYRLIFYFILFVL